jgi:hypothetical protein
MVDEAGKWRVRFIIFATSAFVIFLLWFTSTPFSLLGFLAISFPIVALVYMASVSASRAYPHESPYPVSGTMWGRAARRLPGALAVAGFLWLLISASLFIAAGDLKFGFFGSSIAVVFLCTAFPGRITMARIGVILAGLVVASILFVV